MKAGARNGCNALHGQNKAPALRSPRSLPSSSSVLHDAFHRLVGDLNTWLNSRRAVSLLTFLIVGDQVRLKTLSGLCQRADPSARSPPLPRKLPYHHVRPIAI